MTGLPLLLYTLLVVREGPRGPNDRSGRVARHSELMNTGDRSLFPNEENTDNYES